MFRGHNGDGKLKFLYSVDKAHHQSIDRTK